ncbi:N-acetyltransferase Eis [Microbacterium lemovicicum]|uniref:N-acetyltransferase Eis n=1 Tax=Microbacterium lemovicicum TaxID=1072463 RepID=A0A3Q9IX01_9MICO|nr:GNAT family N-acetyltransferase [Microbacterium lemovicicum]AZS36208.1 N-acetyltransferase Eis [Microbacterium lemovicicum]
MPHLDWKKLPLDAAAVAAASAAGFDYRLVDTSDEEAYGAAMATIRRGFLDDEGTAEQLQAARDDIRYRRFTGVYDDGSAAPATPVATVASWVTELTLPGRTVLPMWAISDVTVAATHRRRGLARTLVEGELRTAADAGLAIAGLTVSEATIYARFGFGPAAFLTDIEISSSRVTWTGPRPAGRLDYLDRDALAREFAALHARVRLDRPGEIEGWPGLWQRVSGVAPGDEKAKSVRGVRWTDAAGTTRGVVSYRIAVNEDDYALNALEVDHLMAETPDAAAALWRFLLEHDLVGVVRAPRLSVDEAVRWMVSDQRAIRGIGRDHEWLRILDVPRVLSARRYGAPGSAVIAVADPLGYAEGTWRLDVVPDGTAVVEPVDAAADLALSVADLGSILLGGVRPSTLRAAGRIAGDADAALGLELMFASPRVPHLSFWY